MAAEKGARREKAAGLFQKLAENDRGRKAVVVAGLVGIFLIFLSGTLKGCGQAPARTASSQAPASAEQYEERLEKDLADVISHISGAGSARVLVTLEQTTEKVYAKDEKKDDRQSDESQARKETENNSESTHTIVKGADGSESALPVTEIQPTVKGVVVVCSGAGDPQVRQSIVDAVTTALHITSVRVCVVQGA